MFTAEWTTKCSLVRRSQTWWMRPWGLYLFPGPFFSDPPLLICLPGCHETGSFPLPHPSSMVFLLQSRSGLNSRPWAHLNMSIGTSIRCALCPHPLQLLHRCWFSQRLNTGPSAKSCSFWDTKKYKGDALACTVLFPNPLETWTSIHLSLSILGCHVLWHTPSLPL